MTIQSWEIRAADDFEKVFAALNKQRPDGLFVTGSPLMGANRKRIADFALKSRLPSMVTDKDYVDAGGLMSYGSDTTDNHRLAAWYVDKILKGAKPADLPVQQASKMELFIDLTTSIAFEREPDEPDLMRRPPRRTGEPLLTNGLLGRIAVAGALTRFGTVAYELRSEIDRGRILGSVTLPAGRIVVTPSARYNRGKLIAIFE